MKRLPVHQLGGSPDEGFHINVKGHTDLKAGLIASTEKAAAANKNTFSTGTLSTSELHNQAQYKASSQSIGLGTSVTPGVPSPAGIGFGSDSESQASITQSGISQAHITITDDVKQKAKTGKNAMQTLAELNRNVSSDKDTSGALTNKFDATRVQNEIDAQTDITKTFGQQTAQAIGTFAQSKTRELKQQADLASTPEHKQQLLDEAAKWDEGGGYRVALHTVAGAMSGGAAGAVAAATVAGSADTLGGFQEHIHTALKNAGAPESIANVTSQIISQTAAAGLGGAVGKALGGATGDAGTGAIAGTATGLNVDANNRFFHQEGIKKIDELAANDP